MPVDARTWRLAKAYWERVQNADGSWGYKQGLFGTGSMTAAGITSLIICNGSLQPPDAQVEEETIICCRRGKPARTACSAPYSGSAAMISFPSATTPVCPLLGGFIIYTAWNALAG